MLMASGLNHSLTILSQNTIPQRKTLRFMKLIWMNCQRKLSYGSLKFNNTGDTTMKNFFDKEGILMLVVILLIFFQGFFMSIALIKEGVIHIDIPSGSSTEISSSAEGE